jgi:putative transposase
MEPRQAFQFELMPNGQQQRQMSRSAGCARYVYNKALALKKERYEKKEKLTRFQLDKLLVEWKQETPWLREAPSHALQQAILDLDRAFTNSFKKRAQFPKFHKKGLRDSFRESDPQCIQLDQVNSRMQLPKIGWVRYRNSREVLGEIRNVTVSLSAGKWFASISTRREVEPPLHPSTSSVGMDWGVARFYTLSDGEYQEQLQPLKKFLPKLAKLQRRLAGKRKFSRNWKKAKARITRLHAKIANIRKDFVHKSSNDISKNHAVVFVEDLQVKNMSRSAKGTNAQPGRKVRQKSGLNRSILDASPFELRRQLEYKTQWDGGLLVAVPPGNTSRKCPECQHIRAENRKRQTKFVCVECGFSAHADWVGAVNIKEAGLASLACSSSSHEVSASCREPTEGLVCASV